MATEESQPSSSKTPNESQITPAKFEAAITAAKFGKFNYLLLLIAIPAGWAFIFKVTTSSFVLPAAKCDLHANLEAKGLLYGMVYFGTLIGYFFGGFISDILGRRYCMIILYFCQAFLVLVSGLSQNFIVLMIFETVGGFCTSGAMSGFITYLLEFYSKRHRNQIQVASGILQNLASIALPLLAWAILTQEFSLEIYLLTIKPWNIFLLVSAIPALVSGIVLIFMPESPKFLMTQGRTQEALKIFQNIYKRNTGNGREQFPIKILVDETETGSEMRLKRMGSITAGRSKVKALKNGFQQIQVILFPPYIKHLTLISIMIFLNMMNLQTLRLWMPQFSQFFSEYESMHKAQTASLCHVIKSVTFLEKNSTCQQFSVSVCRNALIISSISVGCYIISLFIINRLKKKILLGIACLGAAVLSSAIFFSQNAVAVVLLASLFLGLNYLVFNILVVITAVLFQTAQRSTAISLFVLSGNLGAFLGNVIFPSLLKQGCAVACFVMAFLEITNFLLIFLLPNTEMKDLE